MSERSRPVANPNSTKKSINDHESVEIVDCDREPIHIPSAIQPHGLLLVLSEPEFHIAQVSENSQAIVGIAPEQLVDRPLSNFVDRQQLDAIDRCIDRNFDTINPLPMSWKTSNHSSQSFNGIVHRSPSGEIVLELEPFEPIAQQDFFQFYRQIKKNLANIQTAKNLNKLCDLIVKEIQHITGFDRVMVYRFDRQGNGCVIAETKQPNQEAFLGLHYPAADIPPQAKDLFLLNWLRLIPDVSYQPSQLYKCDRLASDKTSLPLDMSYCVLRSVSAMHIEYLQNMNVSATMTISLIQQQKLWGLIACHHDSPKFVPYELRTVCEFLGQLMSTEIAAKEANETLEYNLQQQDLQRQLVNRLNQAIDLSAELSANPEMLLKLTEANGAAVCEGNEIVLVGQTPDKRQVQSLLRWLSDWLEGDLFVTDRLSTLFAEAQAYQTLASGLLAVAISTIQDRYILWFRPEQVHMVTWAGNPEVPTRVRDDGTTILCPRRSFAAWQEIVRGQSRAWLSCEVDGAIALRQAIVDITLCRQANKLAQINQELERSNNELDSFAYIASHDLKEPLRGIHNYATFLLEDYQAILQADGTDKLNTMVRLSKRMEELIEALLRFSRLGRKELQLNPIDLNQLLEGTIELFQINTQWSGCDIRIPKPLPTVWGDRPLVGEIFTNLISNGFKYNQSDEKWVEIGCDHKSDRADGMMEFYIRDNGIGIRPKHIESIFRIFKRLHAPSKYGGGTGAGLTIVKKILQRHGGSIRVESIYGEGTTFWFTLPIQNRTETEFHITNSGSDRGS